MQSWPRDLIVSRTPWVTNDNEDEDDEGCRQEAGDT
jgi:hypothetical protein